MTRPEIVLSVFGSTGVGKSCMTVQFVQKRFMKEHDPTIEDQYTVIRKVEDEEVSLNIYDTAGQEEFVGLRAHYMKGTDGHMLVYSIVDEESLDEISKIHQQIIRATDCPDIPVLVVGNKCDLEEEREVSKEKGKELADKMGCPFLEASAKDRINIDEAFELLGREVFKFRQNHPDEGDVTLKSDKKKCCIM
eukprot:gb/GECH01003159.1/.p1 GENE.gb/GECH01003159.1/~~gb/GECH01003159.1/.p1  ORF type:complete len:192 (+),score=45.90 gb/GECH01003159.1/:1-576(+)